MIIFRPLESYLQVIYHMVIAIAINIRKVREKCWAQQDKTFRIKRLGFLYVIYSISLKNGA